MFSIFVQVMIWPVGSSDYWRYPIKSDWWQAIRAVNKTPQFSHKEADRIYKAAIVKANDEHNHQKILKQVHKLQGACCYTGVPIAPIGWSEL